MGAKSAEKERGVGVNPLARKGWQQRDWRWMRVCAVPRVAGQLRGGFQTSARPGCTKTRRDRDAKPGRSIDPVAQLDSAPGSESGGCRFESGRDLLAIIVISSAVNKQHHAEQEHGKHESGDDAERGDHSPASSKEPNDRTEEQGGEYEGTGDTERSRHVRHQLPSDMFCGHSPASSAGRTDL